MRRYLNEDYRTDLMDEAEELYSDNIEAFEDAFETIMNVNVNDVDDSDPDEGFWAICTDEDIENIIELTKQNIYGDSGVNKNTYEFTDTQISLILRAMEMWSDPSFSRDREESAIAKEIVRYLNKY
jgi:hypothetical protein